MRIPIHRKIFGLSLSGLVLCTLSLGGLALYFTSNILEKRSQEFLENRLAAELHKLEPIFTDIEHYANGISAFILSDIPSLEALKQEETRDEITQKINQYTTTSLNNIKNATSAYLRYNPKFTLPTSGILIMKNSETGEFENLSPTDLSKYDSDDMEHVGWYYLPTKIGKSMWLLPYQNKNINVYVISYVIPLIKFDEDIGVVGIDMDFNKIIQFVLSIKVYQSGYAFLEDENGNIIVHPTLSPGKTLKAKKGFRVLRSALPNGMTFGIRVPEAEINAERYKLLVEIIIFAIFLLILFSFISAMVAYSITKPILNLTETANKLINGDMKVKFKVETNDEIGDLSKSFQTAKDHMQEYLGQIQGLAYRDSLTGIRNRTAYDAYCKEMDSKIATKQLREFGIMACNLNYLKVINDNYGNDYGNTYLINCCQLICAIFCHSPVFRISGDEFIVILMGNDLRNRGELIVQINEKMNASTTAENAWERLSIACGYSLKDFRDTDVVTVQRRAEKEMYRIKKEMKNSRKVNPEKAPAINS